MLGPRWSWATASDSVRFHSLWLAVAVTWPIGSSPITKTMLCTGVLRSFGGGGVVAAVHPVKWRRLRRPGERARAPHLAPEVLEFGEALVEPRRSARVKAGRRRRSCCRVLSGGNRANLANFAGRGRVGILGMVANRASLGILGILGCFPSSFRSPSCSGSEIHHADPALRADVELLPGAVEGALADAGCLRPPPRPLSRAAGRFRARP